MKTKLSLGIVLCFLSVLALPRIVVGQQTAEYFLKRGLAKQNTDDLPGALADFNKAIELDPKFAIAYNNRGLAKRMTGDLEGALADFTTAIELDPKSASKATNNLEDTKRMQNEIEDAIAAATKAIAINPKDVDAYNDRGEAKMHKGDWAGAIADFTKAIELDPKSDEAYESRGKAKQAKGDQLGAERDLAKAARLRQPPPEEPYRLELKNKISLANRNPAKVAIWFHCTKWNTATENYKWVLLISQNGKLIRTYPIGTHDGPLNTGFSGGLDNMFAGLPVGDYTAIAKFKELQTNPVSVTVTK